jgi:phage shock protein A
LSKPDFPERVTKLEQQMPEVNRKADDAITLARGADRDVADFRTELRAHRKSLEALRDTQIDMLTDMRQMKTEMGEMKTEMREGFSTVGVGMAQITALLTTAIGPTDKPPN